MMLVPGVDIDIPESAISAPISENSQPVAARVNSVEFDSLDMRINPEKKDYTLSKLAALRDRLASPAERTQSPGAPENSNLQRKYRLFDSMGDVAEQTKKRAYAALFGDAVMGEVSAQ